MGSSTSSKVLVVLRVNPESSDVDLEGISSKLKGVLPNNFELVKSEKVYVAFGIYALRLYILMPEDYEGGTEELERIVSSIEGVSSVDIELVTRTQALSELGHK